MGSGMENKTKFKKNSFLKNRKGYFLLRGKSSESHHHSMPAPYISKQCYYQGSKGERYSSVNVIRFKETLQKGVCDKEYP